MKWDERLEGGCFATPPPAARVTSRCRADRPLSPLEKPLRERLTFAFSLALPAPSRPAILSRNSLTCPTVISRQALSPLLYVQCLARRLCRVGLVGAGGAVGDARLMRANLVPTGGMQLQA
jgi:hypothetical protein